MEKNALTDLAHKILSNQATGEEIARYLYWINTLKGKKDTLPEDEAIAQAALWARIYSQTILKRKKKQREKYRIAAVAFILIFIGMGSYFLLFRKATPLPAVPLTSVHNDIAPGGNHAVLTLAGGKQVLLDQVDDGQIARQNGTAITKSKTGLLSYHNAAQKPQKSVAYNSLSTPRGGQYQLMLSDGTKVWLNAASSIRFPTVFTQAERKVEITGEVYFEVAHNTRKPFIVSVGSMKVKVLGTHFDVNAYGDDGSIKTTLLQGSVQVSNSTDSRKLIPGQQADVSVTKPSIGVRKVNADDIICWTRGFLHLQDKNVEAFMTQLSRWYDVDVIYKGAIPKDVLGGFIDRNSNLFDVLSALESSGIHCQLKGRKIIISSK